jgi:hypothetical protein
MKYRIPDWLLIVVVKYRMLDWLLIAVALTAIIALIAPHQLSVTLYKLSLVSLAAVVGYWVDRGLFPYARPDKLRMIRRGFEVEAAYLRRAILVAACIVGVSLGA